MYFTHACKTDKGLSKVSLKIYISTKKYALSSWLGFAPHIG